MGSYKGKSLKNSKSTSYCLECGEPDHNASKCKVKHIFFCDFATEKDMQQKHADTGLMGTTFVSTAESTMEMKHVKDPS